MNRVSFLIIPIMLLLFCSTCKTRRVNDLPLLTKENVSGEKLWEQINREKNYTKLPYWPSHTGIHPGQTPHGNYHRIFINQTLASALPLKNKRTPNGSIVIKENYNSNKKLAALTLMAKVEGYDQEHNDWYWVKYTPTGKVMAEGKVEGCFSCHEPMKTNDYIIVQPLDKDID